jgi:hypothetical protein
MIGALATFHHPPIMGRVPVAVGRADGWGTDDSAMTVLTMVTMLLTVAVIVQWVPRHSSRHVNWRIFGRRPQPLPLGLSGMSLMMGYWLVRGATTGALLQGPLGVALGLAAVLSSALMIGGWWSSRYHQWMQRGMVLNGAVWAGLAGANLYAGQWVSGGMAFWISVIVLWSWLAEVTDTGTVGATPGPP